MSAEPVSRLMAGLDSSVAAGAAALRRHPRTIAAVVSPVIVGLIGIAFIPVRSTIGGQNVALILAIAIIAVALWAGALPAVLGGVAGAAVFAVYITEPYGELDITERHDEITTLLLVGLALGLALVRRRMVRLVERAHRQEVDLRLVSVGARDVLTGVTADAESSLAAMADLLRARSCEVRPRAGPEVPRLGPNALIDGVSETGRLPRLAIDISEDRSLVLHDVDVAKVELSDRLAALGLAALISSR